MPNSLRCKLSKLRFQGKITQEEYKELLEKLDGHNKNLRDMYEPKWIPCSERLPEEDGCYLVTTKWTGSYSGNVYIETNMAVFRAKQKEWDCVDIIAWMPLLAPYQPPKMMCEED